MKRRALWIVGATGALLGMLALALTVTDVDPLEVLGRKSGFVVKEIRLFNRVRASKDTLIETLDTPIGTSLFSVSPRRLQERLMALRWIEEVRVERYWSGVVHIVVTEHNPAALWQKDETLIPISRDGTPISSEGFVPFRNLFSISGEEAPSGLETLIQFLEHWPELRAHLAHAHFTKNRSWTLSLKSGSRVLLSPDPLPSNVVQLLRLQRHYGILDAPPLIIDLRAGDRAGIRAASEEAQALVAKMKNAS